MKTIRLDETAVAIVRPGRVVLQRLAGVTSESVDMTPRIAAGASRAVAQAAEPFQYRLAARPLDRAALVASL